MLMTRTPLRISFFGGGTDYPAWFEKNEGAVISTTINKYIYISARYLPPFFEHKSRIVWSHIELVKDKSRIKHPSVREALNFMKIKKGVEIHYDADLPSRTGLGSSSAFTVGLLNSLYALKGKVISKPQLAREAIHIEQGMIKEHVGCQDQIAAAYGGFNLIKFKKDGDFIVTPITISSKRMQSLNRHLLLVFTGFSRTASEIAGRLIHNMAHSAQQLGMIHQMTYEAMKILTDDRADFKQFGKLLDESWKLKKSLAGGISTGAIDDIYDEAKRAGATGGKLLGAGGGGFMLLLADPRRHSKIIERLKKYLIVPFDFEKTGSQTIFYNPETEYVTRKS